MKDKNSDSTFTISKFYKNGFYEPYRLERKSNEGGIIMYLGEYITIKVLTKSKSILGFCK